MLVFGACLEIFLCMSYIRIQYMHAEYVHKKIFIFKRFIFKFSRHFGVENEMKISTQRENFLLMRIFPNFPIASHVYRRKFLCSYLFFIHTDILLSWGLKSKKNERKKLNIRTFQSLFRIWFDYMFSIAVGEKNFNINYKNFSSSHKKILYIKKSCRNSLIFPLLHHQLSSLPYFIITLHCRASHLFTSNVHLVKS